MMAKKAKSAPNKKSEPAVFDVSKPGKATQTIGGRPVIVQQRSVVQDPMVKEGKPDLGLASATVQENAPAIIKNNKPRLVIQPADQQVAETTTPPKPGQLITAKSSPDEPSEEAESVDFKDLKTDQKEASDKPAEAEKTGKPEPPKVIEPKPAEPEEKALPTNTPIPPDELEDIVGDVEEPTETKKAEPSAKPEVKPADETPDISDAPEPGSDDKIDSKDKGPAEKTDEGTESKNTEESKEAGESVIQEPEGGLVDELAKQAVAKKEQQKESKEETVQQERLRGLINDKTYFLPIAQITKRRIRNITITFIVLVLMAAVGLNFAADAGVVDLGMKPLTDVIKNN
jgi:hypothetical protein